MRCNVKCPQCGNILEFNENVIGHEVECPKCQHIFTGQAIFQASPEMKKKAMEFRQVKATGTSKCFSGFLMGLIFTILGVFIAQMMYGTDGAKAAWRGVLAQIIIGIGFWIAAELVF